MALDIGRTFTAVTQSGGELTLAFSKTLILEFKALQGKKVKPKMVNLTVTDLRKGKEYPSVAKERGEENVELQMDEIFYAIIYAIRPYISELADGAEIIFFTKNDLGKLRGIRLSALPNNDIPLLMSLVQEMDELTSRNSKLVARQPATVFDSMRV